SPTIAGGGELRSWLERNTDLRMSLILQVYPTSSTRQPDLECMRRIAIDMGERVQVHLLPLDRVSHTGPNALCFAGAASDSLHLALGPDENLGLDHDGSHRLNLVFRADPALVEGFRRDFDYWWAKTIDITSEDAVAIPELVLPEGTVEAARKWREYV